MFYKVLGLVSVVIGLLIIKYFPDITSYQHEGMTLSGIFIGVVLILVGAGLLIFG